MKHSIYTYLLILVSISIFAGCSFEDEAKDDDTILEVPALEQIAPTATQVAYNQMAFSGWISASFMQYFEQADASIQTFQQYIIGNSTSDWYWNGGLYNGSLKNCNSMILQSQREGNSDIEAIGTILMAKEYLDATTIFGDIPFSEALKGYLHPTPVYDSQESIYQELLKMCDQAIDLIGNGTANAGLTDFDIIYKGKMENWKKFAYALKARIHLHLTTKDPSNYDLVLSSIQNSFTAPNDQPTYQWLLYNEVQNPLNKLHIERPSLFFVAKDFRDILDAKNDPRKGLITQMGNFGYTFAQAEPYEFRWTAVNGTLPLFSFIELYFMKAEAQLMTGASDEEVLESLRMALDACFQEYDLNPEAYVDYLNQHASFEGLNSKEEKLTHIIEEAYVSYYGVAFRQAWNNYKRLGIPDLDPTGGPNQADPSGSVPVRLLYPQRELDHNTANVFEAADRQNGALLDNDLWIFQN